MICAKITGGAGVVVNCMFAVITPSICRRPKWVKLIAYSAAVTAVNVARRFEVKAIGGASIILL